jgi:methylated-DNA-[protein]-cysteine S-methyltransferase
MPQAHLDCIDSPIGALQFATTSEGALLGLHFLDGHYPLSLRQELERDGYELAQDLARSEQARAALQAYFAGSCRAFDISLVFRGSPFQIAVWKALLHIPFGTTRTYAQVAQMLGRPNAARAVGRANATNRIPLVIPCHRVVGADGSLTGFAGGLHLKERLLAFEAAHRPA